MSNFTVTLFGKFNIEHGGQKIEAIRSHKAQELLGYLLLYRNHSQPRERLAEILWGDQPPAKSKKYLRQTLWLLQSALQDGRDSHGPELLIDDEWVQINPAMDFRVDATKFENIYNSIESQGRQELCPVDFKSIQKAVHLYKGDLLEGWYPDWCMMERERFEIMYLMLLDKLVQFCEIRQDHAVGLTYAAEILRHDQGYERAHRQMMRLYFLAGDRTQALRQYERCVIALRNELDVEPSEETKQLYERIRLDTFDPSFPTHDEKRARGGQPTQPHFDMLQKLISFSNELSQIQNKVQEEIMQLKHTLPPGE